MSTILARRLKSSMASPILVQDAFTADILAGIDLRIETSDKAAAETQQTCWGAAACDCEECYASSSSVSSSSSTSTSPSSSVSSVFFEDLEECEQAEPLPLRDAARSSVPQAFTKDFDSCSVCEADSEREESWTEHAYVRDTTKSYSSISSPSSSSSRDSSRRSRPSRSRNTQPTLSSPPASFRPSARSSRKKQTNSSSLSASSSSSSSDEDDMHCRPQSHGKRRSKRLADCECQDSKLTCPPSPHPTFVELSPVVEARLRTTINPQFYLIYSLENVMMKERKIRYPLKDRATHLSIGICKGSMGASPLRAELLVR